MRYMTPKDAAAKWCPFAHAFTYASQGVAAGKGSAGCNRPQDEEVNCISLRCMAWRWRDGQPSTGVGFCGLVGDPSPMDIKYTRDPPLGPNGLPRVPGSSER